MATWLTHLRVADELFDRFRISDGTLFFGGCIAPDSGIDPGQTHWCVNGDKTTCDSAGFYRRYLTGKPDKDFYLGYYVHLLTDLLWHNQKIKLLRGCSPDRIKQVKQGWRCVDRQFLSEKPAFRPLLLIADTAKFQKDWFDYYSVDIVKALADGILRSSSVQQGFCADPAVKQEIELFITQSAAWIAERLSEAGI